MHVLVHVMSVFSAFQVFLNRENKGSSFKAYIVRHAFKVSLCEIWIVTHIYDPRSIADSQSASLGCLRKNLKDILEKKMTLEKKTPDVIRCPCFS